MLDGRQFVLVVTLGPGGDGAGIHRLAVLTIERGGLRAVFVVSQGIGPDLGVLGPEFFICREGIEHLGPLSLPFRMLLTIQDIVGHIPGPDDGAGHQAGDLLARTCHTQDIAILSGRISHREPAT